MIPRRKFIKYGAFGIFVPEAIRAAQPFLVNRRKAFQPSGGTTCTLWSSPILQQQTTDNDFWATSPLAQFLKITASGTVCKVRAKLSRPGTDETVNIGFWSMPDGTGTQTGTTSNNVTINVGTGSAIFFDFTWASNPTLTADIYMVMKAVTANGYRWQADTVAGGTGYQDTTYASYENGIIRNTSDYCFEIWTLQ